MYLFYEDGMRETIISRPDWKVRVSARSLANIYASENHDRRDYPISWDKVYFDDGARSNARPFTGQSGKLNDQSQPSVTLHETVEPVTKKTPSLAPSPLIWARICLPLSALS